MLKYVPTKGNSMAYRHGERNQKDLFPQSIDEYVNHNHPVRAYDAFVDSLDLKDLGITYDAKRVGNSSYDPRTMIKLWTYGPSYGQESSRTLERSIHENVSFIWLMGGLKPDHKTISEFRRNNKEALAKIIKLCARLCIKLNLIEGNILFTDGTKIRANASRHKNHTKKHYEKQLKEIDSRIEEMLNRCDQIDEQESHLDSFVKMKDELANNEQLRSKIKEALAEFEQRGEKTKNGKERTVNMTDTDSALMRSVQGSHASYNVQSVVDEKHGLIVNTDVVSAGTDVNQFAQQITQAEEVTGKECKIACADAGYADTEELEKIHERGNTKVIVPSQRQALHKEESPFSKSAFTYDEKTDTYCCPEGHVLIYKREKEKNKREYRIANAHTCNQCIHYGTCTKSKHGRRITRLRNEQIKEYLEKQYEDEESQEIYALRKARVEHPFGHIKHNLGKTHFHMRTRQGAQAETSIAATCFNIARMITIFGGVQEFIAKLITVQG